MKRNTGIDFILIGFTMMIGLAEGAHLASVVLGWSFTRCAYLFAAAFFAMTLLLAVLCVYMKRKERRTDDKREETDVESDFRTEGDSRKTELAKQARGNVVRHILRGTFILIVLTQIIFIVTGSGIYRQADMTVEVVNSFLAEDGVYTVNPITGRPYTAGIPMRLKILCLPSLYGFHSIVTGVSALALVQKVVPVLVLLLSYGAYTSLGRMFFSENCGKRMGFLVAVSLLFWVSAYAWGMDGFGLLCCGWLGTTIRNSVLLPWLLSLVMRRKWFCSALCILAEACITWTLYGAGVGVLVVALVPAVEFVSRFAAKKRNAGQTGKEAAR